MPTKTSLRHLALVVSRFRRAFVSICEHHLFVLPSFNRWTGSQEICGDAKVKGPPRPHDISGDPTCRRGIDLFMIWYLVDMEKDGVFGSSFGPTITWCSLEVGVGSCWLTLGCSCNVRYK